MSKTKEKKPSTHGTIGNKVGKNSRGQFIKGNKCSVGNKSHTNEKAKALKNALIEAVTEKDIQIISKKLMAKAKQGDVAAAKELFDRLWGRAKQEVDLGENATNTLVDIVARMCGNGGNASAE